MVMTARTSPTTCARHRCRNYHPWHPWPILFRSLFYTKKKKQSILTHLELIHPLTLQPPWRPPVSPTSSYGVTRHPSLGLKNVVLVTHQQQRPVNLLDLYIFSITSLACISIVTSATIFSRSIFARSPRSASENLIKIFLCFLRILFSGFLLPMVLDWTSAFVQLAVHSTCNIAHALRS